MTTTKTTTKTTTTTTSRRRVRPTFHLGTFRSVIGACLGLMTAGCGTDILVGIEGTVDIHPGHSSGGSAAGGSGGSASGGVSGSGGAVASGGAGGSVPTSCTTISTAVGQLNACGRTPGVAWSPDGALLATVTERAPNVHLWRLSDGALVSEPPIDDGAASSGGLSVTFSPDGTLLATAGYAPSFVSAGVTTQTNTNTVNLWNVATGTLARTLPTQCGSYASGLAFSHDGTRLATAGAMGNIEIWNVAAGARLMSIPYAGSVYAAHFSPDDTRLLTTSYLVATAWDATTGRKLFEITGLENEMNEAVYSPNGQKILTTADKGTVKVLDANGKLLQTLTFNSDPSPPYFSHALWIGDGAFVVDDWSGAVKEWTASASGSFAPGASFSLNMQTLGMALSPDRTTLVVGGSSGFEFLTP